MTALAMLASLALTIGVEALLMAVLCRSRRFAAYTVLCNLLTNPPLNLLLLLAFWAGGMALYWPALAVMETAAVAVEAFILARLCAWPAKKALAVSFLLNAASFGVGALFSAFWAAA